MTITLIFCQQVVTQLGVRYAWKIFSRDVVDTKRNTMGRVIYSFSKTAMGCRIASMVCALWGGESGKGRTTFWRLQRRVGIGTQKCINFANWNRNKGALTDIGSWIFGESCRKLPMREDSCRRRMKTWCTVPCCSFSSCSKRAYDH